MPDVPHLAFPVRFDADGHLAQVEQDTLDHVRDQVHVALVTRIGQGTPLRPRWGTPSLNFQQLPLDLANVTALVVELLPAAAVLAQENPVKLSEIVEQGLQRVNVYVSTEG